MHYLDTSVLVAYYCPEPLSKAAQRAIRRARAPTISPLVEVELCSAVAAKVRTGELDKAAGTQIIATFQQHVAEGLYQVVPIAAAEYALARNWLGQFATALRALDSLHLAAAFNNGLTVLTADKALARAGKRLGVKCRLLG